MFNKEVIRIHG